MGRTGKRMIEEAADRLGEMLLETAEGRAQHSYEDLAAAALAAGLRAASDGRTEAAREEAVAAAVHGKLHGADGSGWAGLSDPEKSFWREIARAAIAAADDALLRDLEAAGGDA